MPAKHYRRCPVCQRRMIHGYSHEDTVSLLWLGPHWTRSSLARSSRKENIRDLPSSVPGQQLGFSTKISDLDHPSSNQTDTVHLGLVARHRERDNMWSGSAYRIDLAAGCIVASPSPKETLNSAQNNQRRW